VPAGDRPAHGGAGGAPGRGVHDADQRQAVARAVPVDEGLGAGRIEHPPVGPPCRVGHVQEPDAPAGTRLVLAPEPEAGGDRGIRVAPALGVGLRGLPEGFGPRPLVVAGRGDLGQVRAVGVLRHVLAVPGPGRRHRRAVDVGGGVTGGRVVVGVAPGAGRPHPGPAGDQGQGERRAGNAEPGRRRPGPDAPGLQHQDGQRAGQADRDQRDPGPGEQVAGVGQGEHAFGGGQPGVAGVEHGVPGEPAHQQDQPGGAHQHHAEQAAGQQGRRRIARPVGRRRWRTDRLGGVVHGRSAPEFGRLSVGRTSCARPRSAAGKAAVQPRKNLGPARFRRGRSTPWPRTRPPGP
jgi:hypothetical protein